MALPSYATYNQPLIAAGFGSIFIGRVPGVDVLVEREEAIARLAPYAQSVLESAGLAGRRFITAEQVHDNVVAGTDTTVPASGADGLITTSTDGVLAIYVADCCAVSIVDPVKKVAALVHSGRKGSELDITGVAIDKMVAEHGSDPAQILVHLSPCIRPPHYEIDFAALIRESAARRGVQRILDSGLCTGCDPERYYSYRVEKGKTGRMLALLWIP
jgi:copper oxidase (laccase) domain-containing protein